MNLFCHIFLSTTFETWHFNWLLDNFVFKNPIASAVDKGILFSDEPGSVSACLSPCHEHKISHKVACYDRQDLPASLVRNHEIVVVSFPSTWPILDKILASRWINKLNDCLHQSPSCTYILEFKQIFEPIEPCNQSLAPPRVSTAYLSRSPSHHARPSTWPLPSTLCLEKRKLLILNAPSWSRISLGLLLLIKDSLKCNALLQIAFLSMVWAVLCISLIRDGRK